MFPRASNAIYAWKPKKRINISTQQEKVLTKITGSVDPRRGKVDEIMKLRPLGDRVVLQYKEEEKENASGIILPDSAKEKPQEATVIAVGPGKETDGAKTCMQVKEGDKVIASKYAGTEVKLGDEEYTIVGINDIVAIVE